MSKVTTITALIYRGRGRKRRFHRPRRSLPSHPFWFLCGMQALPTFWHDRAPLGNSRGFLKLNTGHALMLLGKTYSALPPLHVVLCALLMFRAWPRPSSRCVWEESNNPYPINSARPWHGIAAGDIARSCGRTWSEWRWSQSPLLDRFTMRLGVRRRPLSCISSLRGDISRLYKRLQGRGNVYEGSMIS